MTAPLPLRYLGDGQFETPRGWRLRADAEYVVGEVYSMAVEEQRSMAVHRGYMARMKEAWANLPDSLAGEYPSDTHLRRRALIKTGFCQHRDLVASSKAEALRIAAFLKPVNEYALIVTEGCVVREFTAESQAVKAMGKERFYASMDATENWVAELIGCRPEELRRAA